MSEKTVARSGDMGPMQLMRVIQQDDGDMIVIVSDRQAGRIASIEFCMPVSGGGKSPKTVQALRALARAMAEDAKDNPHEGLESGAEFLADAETQVILLNRQLESIQRSFQELHYSLTNWMVIADKEDERAYDRKAVRRAQRVYRDVFGRDLIGDEKPA